MPAQMSLRLDSAGGASGDVARTPSRVAIGSSAGPLAGKSALARTPSRAAVGSSAGPREAAGPRRAPARTPPQAAAPRRGAAPRHGSTGEPALLAIREAQDGRSLGPPYAKALQEIQSGRKCSHWIWYVWPSLAALRPGTSRPSFLLPDMRAVQAYLRDEVLGGRLHEVTTEAVQHLRRGSDPRVLFGSRTDAVKFTEAAELCDSAQLDLFGEALDLSSCGCLEKRAMEAVVNSHGLYRYRGVTAVKQLLAAAGSEAAPGECAPPRRALACQQQGSTCHLGRRPQGASRVGVVGKPQGAAWCAHGLPRI